MAHEVFLATVWTTRLDYQPFRHSSVKKRDILNMIEFLGVVVVTLFVALIVWLMRFLAVKSSKMPDAADHLHPTPATEDFQAS
jgi:hypothetical protein